MYRILNKRKFMKKIKILAIVLITILTLKTTFAWSKAPPGKNKTSFKFIAERKITMANQHEAVSHFLKNSERKISLARPGPLIGITNSNFYSKKSKAASTFKKEKTTWSVANPANTGNYSMPIPAD